MEQNYQVIKLVQLHPNKCNPRKLFEGEAFENLKLSIAAKGVLEPIIVRPHAKKEGEFEIIAGERRFRACKELGQEEVPCIIRELDDHEAFDVMTIENLMREDLTDREEAEGFAAYAKRNGEESAVTLAERTGLKASYIRRRIAVLELPEYILKAWEKEELSFGAIEQLLRIRGDEAALKHIAEQAIQWGESAKKIKEKIDSLAVPLKMAKFNKDECKTCGNNSAVQNSLFDMGCKNAKCQRPECYLAKLQAWFDENWVGHKDNKAKTNSTVYTQKVGWSDRKEITGRTPGQCKECAYYASEYHLDGAIANDRTCRGDASCYNDTIVKPQKAEKAAKEKAQKGEAPDQPEESGKHGIEFLDTFMMKRIPELQEALEYDDVKSLRLTAFAILKSNAALCRAFGQEHKLVAEKGEEYGSWVPMPADVDVIKKLISMKIEALYELIQSMSFAVLLQGKVGAFEYKNRRAFGEHLGINVKKEWLLTEEYLMKKTKGKLVELAAKYGLDKNPKVVAHIKEKHSEMSGDISMIKKPAMIDSILNSGADLTGLVPEEVLNAK